MVGSHLSWWYSSDTPNQIIMVHLLLVEDQNIIRQGLKELLECKPELQIVGEAGNGKAAIDLVKSLYGTPQQADVVLMDVQMPIMNGVTTTQIICQQFPKTKVLVLTTFDDDVYVSQAMQFGAKGYLLKDTPLEELAQAILSVHQGYTQLGPGLFEKMMIPMLPPSQLVDLPSELLGLTRREREVLSLIAKGASNREIAETLFISERTVKNHIHNILGCLQLRDRTQAALYASAFLPLLNR